jgi:MSHA biogenesis protein MshO
MGQFFINANQRGFTLVEAILVIVITGILSAMVAVFIRAPIEGYIDTVARAELTDAGDTALRRMARDVQAALPNSLRAAVGGSPACFEFLPAVGGGRYRVAQSSVPDRDVLNFAAADDAFDVLASTSLPPPGGYATPHHVVIYNLGIPGADAYTNVNRAAIAAASTFATITLTPPKQFPFQSPGNRFHVIPNFSVVYSCAGGALRRSTRPLAVAATGPMAACPPAGTAGESVLVGNVNCGLSAFNYIQAASQRNGLLTMTLVLNQPGARGDETIQLYQEVHVNNVP